MSRSWAVSSRFRSARFPTWGTGRFRALVPRRFSRPHVDSHAPTAPHGPRLLSAPRPTAPRASSAQYRPHAPRGPHADSTGPAIPKPITPPPAQPRSHGPVRSPHGPIRTPPHAPRGPDIGPTPPGPLTPILRAPLFRHPITPPRAQPSSHGPARSHHGPIRTPGSLFSTRTSYCDIS